MTDAPVPTQPTAPSWFDKRITLSGLIQIVLLMFALFKFSSDIDKRTALVEMTLKSHEEMLKANLLAIEGLEKVTQRIATIIEQYQRVPHP